MDIKCLSVSETLLPVLMQTSPSLAVAAIAFRDHAEVANVSVRAWELRACMLRFQCRSIYLRPWGKELGIGTQGHPGPAQLAS